jgi:hypothetical protein
MLVTNQIPALYNGVSQQPATLRAVTQAEAQENCWSTIVDGLKKRNPSEHLAKILDALPEGAYVHEINRDSSERYVVIVTGSDVKVFDLDGNPQTVLLSAGEEYLAVPPGETAKTNFALVTVADYTFVVNKSVTVGLAPVGADQEAQSLDQWWLNRPNEGETTGAKQLQYPPNPATFGITGSVQSFQKLPEVAGQGEVYEIKGTDESGFTTYYVIRDGGVWNEVVRPGLQNLFDAATMPHALVRIAPGVFELNRFSWAPRRVGDEYTNPHPTFVGRQVRDVFFYKNRLGFAVDENAVLSRAGDFGVFHRMTVLDVLADDVIDVAASETTVAKLDFAVPFASALMLFSDQVQFRLNHEGRVSPGAMSLDVATRYQMSKKARPAGLGSDVYFVAETADWAKVYEYYVKDDAALTDAAELTAHVPRYIPAGVTKVIPAGDHDALFVLTAGAPNRIYGYKFYWQDENSKAQSAWCHWELDADANILSGTVVDNSLHLVVERPTGVSLERISLDSGRNAPGLDFQVYLDRRVQLSGTYFPTDDWTEFVLPYDVRPEDRSGFRVVLGGGFTGRRGALVNSTTIEWHPTDARLVRVRGDYSVAPVLAGFAYRASYTFSEQFMKSSQEVPVTTGRLQLRTFTVYYTDTAFFRTEVRPYGADAEVETIVPAKMADFTGKTLGDASLVLGEPSFHEGSYSFQIYGNSDVAVVTLSNDSHLASNFQSAEWEGFYQNRARFR